jgi:hypothetical protein
MFYYFLKSTGVRIWTSTPNVHRWISVLHVTSHETTETIETTETTETTETVLNP